MRSPLLNAAMADRDGLIWLDGAMIPWRDATTHLLSHTLHYGLGCFEGVRAYETARGPAIFRLTDHTERLLQSAHILQMEMPFDAATLNAAQVECVRANQLQSAYLRPLVFLGAEKMGVDPTGAATHVMIAAWEWGNFLGPEKLAQGIRVKTSSIARHHVNVQLCRAKAISTYANSIFAVREAKADGYDEALLLDTDGFVAEGPGENIFIVKRGEIFEPELTSGLDGITRRTVIQLAQDMGVKVTARRLTRDDIYSADEAFFTGTAAEVVPIIELDRRKIGPSSGRGTPGPITLELQRRFFACVRGEDSQYEAWLTRC